MGIRHPKGATKQHGMPCAGIRSAHPKTRCPSGQQGQLLTLQKLGDSRCHRQNHSSNPIPPDEWCVSRIQGPRGIRRLRRGLHAARRTASETIVVITMVYAIDLAPAAPGSKRCAKHTDGCRWEPRHRVVHMCTLTNRQLSC